jgi:hypothetical protein
VFFGKLVAEGFWLFTVKVLRGRVPGSRLARFWNGSAAVGFGLTDRVFPVKVRSDQAIIKSLALNALPRRHTPKTGKRANDRIVVLDTSAIRWTPLALY